MESMVIEPINNKKSSPNHGKGRVAITLWVDH